MKINSIKLALLAVLGFMLPSVGNAQDAVTLANWTFENEADVTGWFTQGNVPSLSPDECIGEKSDYVMTAMSSKRYWQTCGGYNTRVLRIDNSNVDANNITDYTDASQHDIYFEAQFPTKGYDNIAVSFAIASGNNEAVPMTVVVSTDGGENWFNAGTYTSEPTWWTYKTSTFNLSAKNKDKVMVRVIMGNGYQTNWNLDFFKVEGTVLAAAQPIDAKDATVYWPFKSGADSESIAEVSVEGAVSSTSFSLGSNLKFNGIRTNELTITKLMPYETINRGDGNATAQNAVTFTVIPKKGVTFKPTKLSFNAEKIGTSGGTLYIDVIAGETTKRIANPFDPQGTGKTASEYAKEIGIDGIDAAEKVEVKFYITNLSNNKDLGLGDVKITGDFEGTPEAVPSYTFSVKLGTPGAGNVSVTPSGAEFDEGTELTVKATENFGYHFASWNDEDGNVVSTENPYTFEIGKNTVLTAVYTKKNVYPLNITLEGGANANGVLFSPVGNVVEGVHYYEEGTDVKLTAQNNRILTFTNWEDNTTSMVRDIKMDSEKNVTATFSCEDFIVGWDLYNDDPNSERTADYRAESENAGLLSLHNEAGQTTGWLAGGAAKGAQRGKYCARVWKAFNLGYYFEISFSSKGYSNLKLSAALGNDFPSYNVYNAEYSVDGQNYTAFASWELPNRGWTEKEVALPAEAAGQDKVYIRFIADKTSGFTGANSETATDSTTDGFSVAEIYVLADADASSDETAPILVTSIPANGSDGASASGSIILTFDEKIKVGENGGAATLNGETITPTISAKSAVYPYVGLNYGKEYTFTLPAGAITDRNGNKFAGTIINFTTMERTQPEAKLYDAVVAQDGSGDYTSVQAAIDAAPTGRAKAWLIFIKAGKYNEHIDIPASKPYIHLIGQDRNLVEIYDNKLCGGENAVHVSVGATVVVNSNNCFFEGINFVNSYGRDMNNGPQALAMNTIGDRIAFNKVGMISYQDTWITTSTSNNRHFIKNSWIEGAVDFIYNSGNVYLDQDTINIVRKSGGYIVAPSHNKDVKWGYVFMNNVITAKGVTGVDKQPESLNCKPSDVEVWLGRPWHNFPKTVFINTKMEVTVPATGWYETMGGLPALWADYNSVDGNGNPIDLSNRRDTYYRTENGEKIYGKAKNYLTDEEAAQYTVKNVMSGDDGWQPELLCEACAAPTVVTDGNSIKWQPVPYAICYVITKNGEVVDFTTECSYDTVAGADYKVQAVNEFGGLSEAAVPGIATAIEIIENNAVSSNAPIYNIAGQRVNSSAKGILIINGKKIIK